jgi:radical SAM superfamily enzyme YgiQ (UPF0313 family)
MNRRRKVLLIQLPSPQYQLQKQWGNIPLGAASLKAAAFGEGLLNDIDTEILGSSETNLSGDAKLIGLIVSKSPDLLGWSLFLYNAKRSLYISREIKKRLPQTKIIIGGPEVATETGYILNDPSVDMGCFGEGEIPFLAVLKSLFYGKPDLSEVPGIFYKNGDHIFISHERRFLPDLNIIRSPFLLGYLDIKNFAMVTYEASRGCPFHCIYCHASTIPVRCFSTERVCSDMAFFIDSGVKSVRFVDNNILLHPDFHHLFTEIGRINKDRRIGFYGFSYAEHLSEEKANLLKSCNCNYIEVGLQTIHAKTLRSISRPPFNARAFVEGIRLLEKYDIEYSIDVIIGLPGETYEDYKDTVDFLKTNRSKHISGFPLMVLPGTRLNALADQFGIRHQKEPPYYLIDTDAMDSVQIKRALKLSPADTQTGPTNQDDLLNYGHAFAYYFDDSFLSSNVSVLNKKMNVPAPTGLHKLIIETGESLDSTRIRTLICERVKRSIHSPFTLWLKIEQPAQDFSRIAYLLNTITQINPFTFSRLVLEPKTPIQPELISRLGDYVQIKERLVRFDHPEVTSVNKYLLYPWKKRQELKHTTRKRLSKEAILVWSVSLSEASRWQNDLEQIRSADRLNRILIQINKGSSLSFILEVMDYLIVNRMGTAVYFSNLAFHYCLAFMNLKAHSKEKPGQESKILHPLPIETTISITGEGEIRLDLFPCAVNELRIVALQTKLSKHFRDGSAAEASKLYLSQAACDFGKRGNERHMRHISS